MRHPRTRLSAPYRVILGFLVLMGACADQETGQIVGRGLGSQQSPTESTSPSPTPSASEIPQAALDLALQQVTGYYEGSVEEVYGLDSIPFEEWVKLEPLNSQGVDVPPSGADPVYAAVFRGSFESVGPPYYVDGEFTHPVSSFSYGRIVFTAEGDPLIIQMSEEEILLETDSSPGFGSAFEGS